MPSRLPLQVPIHLSSWLTCQFIQVSQQLGGHRIHEGFCAVTLPLVSSVPLAYVARRPPYGYRLLAGSDEARMAIAAFFDIFYLPAVKHLALKIGNVLFCQLRECRRAG